MPVLLSDYPFISNRKRSQSRSRSPIRNETSTHRISSRNLPPSRDSNSSLPVEEHSRFYFDDEIVSFLVENRVKIRVHKHFLARESSFFRGVFASGPRGPQNTYVVEGLRVNEFESLLGFFYDGMYRLSPSNTPIQAWVDLLSISTQFDFPKIRDHAIAAIDECQSLSSSNSLSPADMIHIADKHHVEKWLKPAYMTLCEREEPISKEEAEKIGVEKVVMLAQARERLLKIKLEDTANMLTEATAAASQEKIQSSGPNTSPSDPQTPVPPGTQVKPGWRTIHPRASKSNLPNALTGWDMPMAPLSELSLPKSPLGSPLPQPRNEGGSWSSASSGATKIPSPISIPFPANSAASYFPEDIPVPLVEERQQTTGNSGMRTDDFFKQIFGVPFLPPAVSSPTTPKSK
ncbi:hypothetical protein PM082_008055 [Marasmius tenuissimus]|nr:hypothetical protein PM082_008055 [Marasmius tenuissimus]